MRATLSLATKCIHDKRACLLCHDICARIFSDMIIVANLLGNLLYFPEKVKRLIVKIILPKASRDKRAFASGYYSLLDH